GDSVRLIREDDSSTFNGQISKKVDLNFDGLDDFIINFGQCGNWGDCLYGIYVQKTDQKYTCVFHPEYWYSGKWDLLEKEFTRVDGVQWMKLRLYSRTDYGGGPPGIVTTSSLQFDGSRYQNIELQSLTNWPNNMNETETFGVQKEYAHRGKTYQVGRMLLKDFQYGPLTLRVIEKDTITDIIAPIDEYPDLEMSRVELIQLHGRPFFFVIDRYRVYLVDLPNEKISARIQPDLGVEYGDDSIRGTVNGFQFFDDDNYLLGIAVSYGVFCFNISDLDDPKELLRYTSDFSDRGQPYFFWSKMPTAPTMVLFRGAIRLRNQVMFPTSIPQPKKQPICFGMHRSCRWINLISTHQLMKHRNLLCCFTKKIQTAKGYLG
ncbi:MAG TPA: hypothetical protein VKZ57_17045, partial [Sphingobacterium sp.]|nr:hypothetical protein [Sphingobacterium sp.]